MAVIIPIVCPATGRKGVEVKGLPTKHGHKKTYRAYEPDAFAKALKAWKEDRQRTVVIRFALARCGNA